MDVSRLLVETRPRTDSEVGVEESSRKETEPKGALRWTILDPQVISQGRPPRGLVMAVAEAGGATSETLSARQGL